MFKIIRYTFFDLIRSSWSYVYLMFYLLIGFVLLFLMSELSKSIITLLNIVIILTPLIATVFGIMYFYNSREFVELLLSQPIKRRNIFLGQYVGMSVSLSLSLVIGLGLPFILYGILYSNAVWDFSMLLLIGVFLNFIFVGFSFCIGLLHDNKIKGFSYAILLWLFLAVIYDGFFLTFLLIFNDYPLEKFTLLATLFNPIDLSRILILLKLDISALMSYTGEILKLFFGSNIGILVALGMLCFWVLVSVLGINFLSRRKDF